MQNYAAFYKAFGVRSATMFRSPKAYAVTELCKGATIHLPAEDGQDFPDTSSVFLKKLSNRIYLYNELELVPDNHSMGAIRIQKESLIREWVSAHKSQFQVTLKPVSSIVDENQLVAVNYGLSDNGYRYPEANKLSPYLRWLDIYKTLWTRVAEIGASSRRQNFILMKTGSAIPSKTALNIASKGFTTTNIPFFDDGFKRTILDIWKWINPETRSQSAMGVVPLDVMSRVNLLFQMFDGTSVILNLGYLNNWIKVLPPKKDPRTKDEVLADLQKEKEIQEYLERTGMASSSRKPPEEVQLDFLRFLIVLQNYNLQGEKAAREKKELLEADRQNVPDTSEEIDDTGGEGLASSSISSQGPKTTSILEDVSGRIKGTLAETTPDVSEFRASEAATGTKQELVAEEVDSSFEEELRIIEEMESRQVKAKGSLGEISYDPDDTPPLNELQKKLYTPPALGDNIIQALDKMVDRGSISAAEYRKNIKALENFKNLPDPFTGKGNILEAATYKPQDLVFNVERTKLLDPTGVAPVSVQSSCVEELDRGYVTQLYRKEVLASVISVMNLGVIVENLEIIEVETIEGKRMDLSMTLKPLGGKASQIRHRLPVPEVDGTFRAKGVRYHSRKQINDVNFRKIHGDEVGLTSFTSKLFINRTRAKAHNTLAYITKHLTKAQMGELPNLSSVRMASVYDNEFKAPFIYSTMSQNFKSFKAANVKFGGLELDFETRARDKIIDEKTRSQIENSGNVLCGKTGTGQPIFVGEDNIFKVRTRNGDEPIGTIYDVLQLDEDKSPVEFAEMSILGKSLPVGIVLGRQLGFRNLLKLTGCEYRMEEGRSVRVAPNEFRVRFKDQNFIFNKRDNLASLIFGGFTRIKEIKNYPVTSFDSTEVYDVLLESQDLNQMHLREIDNLSNGFIDPITLRRLQTQGKPETFTACLFEACKELTHNSSPDTQDTDERQVLGYERFAGAIYHEVYKAFRSFRNQNSTGRGKINMSHFATWQRIMEDGTIKTCEDINPIQNLKMHEAMTVGGEGGRSRETFNVAARAFHIKDPGISSEGSVDSGDVAYNVFAPWNPIFGDLNGKRKPTKELGFGNLLSTSLNLVAGPNHNDMKRNGFTSIQNTHTIACKGYEQPRVQTTVESLVGQRTDDLFCKTASQDGKVVQITTHGIVVAYKDGTREGVLIGRRYGDAEGTTYPHDVATDLKVGDKVSKGETIAYNKGFFEPSTLNPKFSVLKFGVYATVAFIEVPETHEDSCSISPALSDRLNSETVDPRSYVLRFTQNVHDVLKPGSLVDPDTVLMVIEDEITSGTGVFDAQSTTTLGRLGRDAPRAGHTGVLDRIECFYHGDKADLSPTIRKLVDASDRLRAEQGRSVEKQPITGRASSDWSINGKPLRLDHVEIVFYISKIDGMGNADKVIFGEQLKSTVGKVEMRKIVTESGRVVDAIFGGSSVMKRIVLTLPATGSTIAIADHTSKRVANAYLGR